MKRGGTKKPIKAASFTSLRSIPKSPRSRNPSSPRKLLSPRKVISPRKKNGVKRKGSKGSLGKEEVPTFWAPTATKASYSSHYPRKVEKRKKRKKKEKRKSSKSSLITSLILRRKGKGDDSEEEEVSSYSLYAVDIDTIEPTVDYNPPFLRSRGRMEVPVRSPRGAKYSSSKEDDGVPVDGTTLAKRLEGMNRMKVKNLLEAELALRNFPSSLGEEELPFYLPSSFSYSMEFRSSSDTYTEEETSSTSSSYDTYLSPSEIRMREREKRSSKEGWDPCGDSDQSSYLKESLEDKMAKIERISVRSERDIHDALLSDLRNISRPSRKKEPSKYGKEYRNLCNARIRENDIVVHDAYGCIFVGDDVILVNCESCTVIGDRTLLMSCTKINIYGYNYCTGKNNEMIIARGTTVHQSMGVMNI